MAYGGAPAPWDPWLELFQDAGYAATAPGWPGDADTIDAARRNPGNVAGKGIDDVINHYAQSSAALPPAGRHRPLLRRPDRAAAPARPGPGRCRSRDRPRPHQGRTQPAGVRAASRLDRAAQAGRPVTWRYRYTAEQFRYGFGNALPEQESAELFDRWTVPSPGKPLFEAGLENFTGIARAKVNTGNKTRGPLLITAGGQDHTVPAAISTSTRRLYHKSPAISDFVDVPRSRALADGRPRLARGRPGRAGLARAAVV